ncbi:hypothetical protein CEY02_16445 [Bacillus pumilus]|uniref:Membrane bound lipoprotein n=1 Tax=Bacillus pumilus TaxID=1408 RepID=A0A2A5IQD9_BACPU|nr:hypothetical protein [Bacillus pumilus]PCK19604.1 hypothetical protein CEY02_16445 [Bacillus pumilus]
MKKLITMPFLVLLLGVILTACGTTNQSNDNTDNSKKETTADQSKENASDETTEDKSTNEKTDDQSKETTAQTEDQAGQSNEDSKESSSKEITKEEPSNDQSKDESTTKKESTTNKNNEVTKEGTYVGLADGHTIAVNIDGKEVAIQFGNSFSKQVNSLKEESKVKVTYTKDANGTLRLKTIESVKAK